MMGRRGRPSKSGTRTGSGRLKRNRNVVLIDKGNDRAEVKADLYGANGWDPIGRAFTMGLLGDGAEAKQRLDTARKVASLYRRTYGGGYRCALDDSPRGASLVVVDLDREAATKRQEEWLAEALSVVASLHVGAFFDQLVDQHNQHGDNGPPWLTRLCEQALANRARAAAKRCMIPFDERDWIVLMAAIKGLDAITPKAARPCIATTRAA